MKYMDFYGFILSLYNDWIARMSGAASVLFAILGFIPFRKFSFLKKQVVQRKIFWGMALFVSCWLL